MAKPVVVFGSFVVDLMARADHLPVPGETVKSDLFKMGPGGKGFNQAVATKRAGAEVEMVTKLGKDSFANVCLEMMEGEGMDRSHVFVTDRASTGAALIMVDEHTSQNQILVTLGACSTFDDADIAQVTPLIEGAGILLTQLETNVDAVEKVIDIAHRSGTKVVLNTAPVQPITDEMLRQVDVITPNEVEASILTGVEIKTPDDALKAAQVFLDKGVGQVVITLGKQGVLAVTPQRHQLFGNYDVPVLDTTGAGDAFNGGFVAALAEGKDLFEACAFGNAVSNLAVTKMGTSVAMPHRAEVDAFIAANGLMG